MKFLNFLGFFFLGILFIEVEGRKGHAAHHAAAHHSGGHHGGGHGHKGPLHKIKSKVSVAGRKLLDKPPKHRSRFDKYPFHIMRYHQFIWKKYFRRYLQAVHDGRPKLPSPKCWSIKCWMRRNKFKRYWKWRAPIPIEGKNSPPFLHRRCRIPGTHGSRCRKEHLRHDYYWRMFMWVGRYGFPKNPPRKRICITHRCRIQKMRWRRYWKNFWKYTSLVPTIRPYDFNWKRWFWKSHGNQMRLQQIISPALMAMGIHIGGGMMGGGGMYGGGMYGGGMMGGGMMMSGGRYLTIEMKQALLTVMQRNLAQTMQIANTSQYVLQKQKMALMMLMGMPAFPSAVTAQMQMQQMMRNMQYQQYMQQYRMQNMLQQQIWGMGRYLRGSCGCGMCSAHPGGMYGRSLPAGASMYYNQGGMINPINTAVHKIVGASMLGMPRGGTMSNMMGIGMTRNRLPNMPLHPVNNQLDLKMRVAALYAKNNLPV